MKKSHIFTKNICSSLKISFQILKNTDMQTNYKEKYIAPSSDEVILQPESNILTMSGENLNPGQGTW